MVNKKRILLGLFLVVALPMAVMAQLAPPFPPPPTAPGPPPIPVVQDPSVLTGIYQSLMGTWSAAMSKYAFDIFATLAILDLSLFGWRLWKRSGGDLRLAMQDITDKVLVMALFLMLLVNAGPWMFAIIDGFVSIGKNVSGVQSLGPSLLLAQGFSIAGTMLFQATKSGAMLDLATSAALILAAAAILVSFLVISAQFIVTTIQMYIAIAFAPIFMAFGGSQWTTNYVERYFAFSFATGIKLMVLYVLTGAAWPLTNTWVTRAQTFGIFSAAGVENAWVIGCGAILYAFIVWHVSSIVSSMLAGSPNLGHSDVMSFMGPAISAGVTSGMVAAGLMTAGLGAAGGAAAGGAASAGSRAAASGGGGAGVSPSGAKPPAMGASGGASSSSGGASGGGVGSAAGKAIGQLAQAGARAANSMPSGGAHHSPPSFKGFSHD